jgi:hypothetical protein
MIRLPDQAGPGRINYVDFFGGLAHCLGTKVFFRHTRTVAVQGSGHGGADPALVTMPTLSTNRGHSLGGSFDLVPHQPDISLGPAPRR